MALIFFNTYSRRREEFKPIESGHVRMYTCGPTVYGPAHLGNFRTYMFEDLLRRFLIYKGYKVTQVMNLTDVDDKTIRDSNARGISLEEHTIEYKEMFFRDIDRLNIQRAEYYPSATEHINEMVELVQKLLDKGHAYKSGGSVYYRISTFPEYGALSHMKLEKLKEGSRIDSDEYEKETASDFALWKAWEPDDGNVFWETPLGKGRPGWHIECSAMSMKYLGETFDIHTGGVDNIFPHHENEIAQSEGATGKKFVNYWLHSEHLIIEGKKMAKSEGNFYTLQDLVDRGENLSAVRYLLLSTYYRQQLNFTFEALNAAKNAITRLRDFRDIINNVCREKSNTSTKINPEVETIAQTALGKFETSLDDDLNISPALAAVFDFVKSINVIREKSGLSVADAQIVEEALKKFDSVLGVIYVAEEAIDEEIERLIEKRNQARRNKDFTEADRIRDELDKMGITLEDTSSGTHWKRKL
ncbi:MAG: cysteine--tRNA ligase [candidate division Zixibacteria bacterium 4484_95]|nr:MAG: cysteine--tRNA ligase [candidate division Zixibacteria bacterium 4484_95]